MKVKLQLLFSDGQELYLVFYFLFVEIQDVFCYGILGYYFKFQPLPFFTSSYFTNSQNLFL